MAVYKCHHGCVCIHRGSYRLLDVLLPRRSALCISLPPVVSGPDASILIPTCYRPFQPPSRSDEIWMCASLCCPIPVCLKVSLMPIYCVPKSPQLAAVPVLRCFPVLLTICLSQRDEIWMHVFSFSVPLLFFFLSSHLPVILTKCLFDEIWMHVPCPSLHHLLSVSAVHRSKMKYRCMSPQAWSCKCRLPRSITGKNYARPF